MSESRGRRPVESAAERRSTDLLLARLHLRVGSLTLARTELETLAGRGPLEDDALVDLAEARWRTGEIALAGAAATAALDHGVEAPLALMIAAEAASQLGRPGESGRLATRAMTAAGGTLDALFAGMPRSAVWPPDPVDPAPAATTLFGSDHPEPSPAPPAARIVDPHPVPGKEAVAGGLADPSTPGLWDPDEVPAESPPSIDPSAIMGDGLAALADGEPDRAAALLGLAIRLGPHLAPAILDGTIDVTEAGLLLVRGDAFRSTGSDADAALAYAAAGRALGEDRAAAGTEAADAALQSGPTSPPPQ